MPTDLLGREYETFRAPDALTTHGPARIIAMCNQKGGVGKTTSSINIAGALSQYGRRVLIVDFDPQGAATVGLGINANALDNTVYTALFDSSVDVHDVIIIDCQPSLGLLTVNALTAADGVIIPVAAEFFALRGVALLMQSIEKVQHRINPDLQVFGVLVTMFTRTLHSEEVLQRIYEAFQGRVLHSVISRSIKLPDSTVAAVPITIFAPEHKTCLLYTSDAADE